MYKKRIANLLNAIDAAYTRGTKQRDSALDVVEVALELFPRCASGTYSKNMTLELAKLQTSPKTYEGMRRDLEHSNEWLFDEMLRAVEDMNNLCIVLGVEKIYDGPTDSISIEEFCRAVIKEYFDERTR